MVQGHSLTYRLAVGLCSVYDVLLVTSGAASWLVLCDRT